VRAQPENTHDASSLMPPGLGSGVACGALCRHQDRGLRLTSFVDVRRPTGGRRRSASRASAALHDRLMLVDVLAGTGGIGNGKRDIAFGLVERRLAGRSRSITEPLALVRPHGSYGCASTHGAQPVAAGPRIWFRVTGDETQPPREIPRSDRHARSTPQRQALDLAPAPAQTSQMLCRCRKHWKPLSAEQHEAFRSSPHQARCNGLNPTP